MATNDKPSEPAEATSWSPKRPRTAAEQRAARHEGTNDPEVLAHDIEKTREELAQTLDAIADKVSPKRVASRTAHDASEAVKDAAAHAKDAAVQAKDAVKEKVAARGAGSGAAAEADRSPLAPATSVEVGSAAPVAGASPLPASTVSVDVGDLPPAEPAPTPGSLADAADRGAPAVEPAGAEVPPYRAPSVTSGPSSPVPALVGAGAALAVLLLLWRRRRR